MINFTAISEYNLIRIEMEPVNDQESDSSLLGSNQLGQINQTKYNIVHTNVFPSENKCDNLENDRYNLSADIENNEVPKMNVLNTPHFNITSNELLQTNGKECESLQHHMLDTVIYNENKQVNVNEPGIHKTKFKVWEFDWMSYLESANKGREDNKGKRTRPVIEAVANHLFLHVEASLDGGVREGMIVEIPYNDYHGNDPEESTRQFWLARVDAVYGPLLKLSYVGYKDKKPEIWHDLTKKRLFPLGTNYIY